MDPSARRQRVPGGHPSIGLCPPPPVLLTSVLSSPPPTGLPAAHPQFPAAPSLLPRAQPPEGGWLPGKNRSMALLVMDGGHLCSS